MVHGGASMAASAVVGESEGEEGRVSCVRGEGPGGSGVSKRVQSESGGSRRWLRLLCVHHAVVLLAKEGDDWRLALVGWAVLGRVR